MIRLSIDTDNFISAQEADVMTRLTDIINTILVGIGRYKPEDKIPGDATKTFRIHFENFFVGCLKHDKTDYRVIKKESLKNNPHVIPKCDVALTGCLMAADIDAVATSEHPENVGNELIQEWLSNKLEIDLEKNPSNICSLVSEVRKIIGQTCYEDLADKEQAKTWMDTIELSLGYSIAQHELEINKLMADMKTYLTMLDYDRLGMKRFTKISEENGVITLERTHMDIRGKTVDQIVKEAETTEDILEAILQFVQMLHDSSKARMVRMLEKDFELKPAVLEQEARGDGSHDSWLKDESRLSIASPTVVMYDSIVSYLNEHPDFRKDLAKKANETEESVVDWFRHLASFHKDY